MISIYCNLQDCLLYLENNKEMFISLEKKGGNVDELLLCPVSSRAHHLFDGLSNVNVANVIMITLCYNIIINNVIISSCSWVQFNICLTFFFFCLYFGLRLMYFLGQMPSDILSHNENLTFDPYDKPEIYGQVNCRRNFQHAFTFEY